MTILKAEICQKKSSISCRGRSLESRSFAETAQPEPTSVFCVLVWHFHDFYGDTQYIIESQQDLPKRRNTSLFLLFLAYSCLQCHLFLLRRNQNMPGIVIWKNFVDLW